MDVADQPLAVILNLKEEPADEEEAAMRNEVQASTFTVVTFSILCISRCKCPLSPSF